MRLDLLRAESRKLFQVTRFLLAQYGRALVSKDVEAKDFLTDVYLRGRPDQALLSRTIPFATLPELFPGIESVSVKLMGRYDSFLSNRFRKDTDYLVSPKELLGLCALVAHLKPRSIFEIGTYRGATLASMALNAPDGCMIRTLDHCKLKIEDAAVREIFTKSRIIRECADSKSFDFSLLEGSVDFVFVDGSHTNPEVEIDTENALRIVSPEGTVVWHDYNTEFQDVVQCLARRSREVEIFHIMGTALAVHTKREGRPGLLARGGHA